MKVLQIWEIAGVASTLSKFLIDEGYYSKVICSDDGDPYGFTPNHINTWEPLTATLLIAEARKYDLIHIHYHDEFLPLLKRAYPSKPLVMHYHGSDVRGKDRSKFYRYADAILYSTKNLAPHLPLDAEYLPNPVDTSLFTKREAFPAEDTGLYFKYNSDEDARRIAEDNGVKLRVMERNQRYADMPRILAEQRFYISAKHDRNGTVLMQSPEDTGSLTELQALATGCTVLRHNCKRVELPPEHEAEAVATRVASLYGAILHD